MSGYGREPLNPWSTPAPPPLPAAQPAHKTPIWAWVLAGVLGVVMLSCLTCIGVVAWIGTVAPDPAVVAGGNLRNDHRQTMQDLGLLDPGEQVRFFYSDALTDVTGGFYTLTDRKLVLYSTAWDTPAVRVAFTDVDATFSDSWIEDSLVFLTLKDGTELTFPLSSQDGGDHRFIEAFEQSVKAAGGSVGE